MIDPALFLSFQRQDWHFSESILSHTQGARFLMQRCAFSNSLLPLSDGPNPTLYAKWTGVPTRSGLDAIEYAFCPHRRQCAQQVEQAVLAYIAQEGLVDRSYGLYLSKGVLLCISQISHPLPKALQDAYETHTLGVVRFFEQSSMMPFQPFEQSFYVEPSAWSQHQRLMYSAIPWQERLLDLASS